MSALYVISTPIGNLEDMTFRAVRILSEVDLIAAEDTRHTKILLDKYNITKPMSSYHKFNIKSKTGYFVELIKSGKSIALVTDAGTPAICDPGFELVREVIAAGLPVIISSNVGAKDLVQEGKNGFIVSNTTDSDYIAAKIALLCDENIRRPFSQAAYQTATQNTWEQVVAKYSKIYADILAGRNG